MKEKYIEHFTCANKDVTLYHAKNANKPLVIFHAYSQNGEEIYQLLQKK